MSGYVVNSSAEPIAIEIVNRKGNLIERVELRGNDSYKLMPGQFYLSTYMNYDTSPPEVRICLRNGKNTILL